MPEIGTSSSMSGDGKRSVGHRPQATAPVLDSTIVTRYQRIMVVGNGPKQTLYGLANLWRTAYNPSIFSFSLTDIAYRMGFNSSSHFSTVFRKKYGMSPSELRKR